MQKWKIIVLMLSTGLLFCCASSDTDTGETPPGVYRPGTPASDLAGFEGILETIRTTLKIPGLAAGILKNGKLVWSRGFGEADIEAGIPAGPETRFHLASLTKPFGALVIMILVEEGRLGLDDRISKYGVSLANSDEITIRHLLSHTSNGTPGTRYQYDGGRYALLGDIIAACTGRSFCEEIRHRITIPAGLEGTAQNPRIDPNCFFENTGEADEFMAGMAQGYVPSGTVPTEEPLHFSPAAGLVSSVADLAEFSRLLDGDFWITAGGREEMMTPVEMEGGGTSHSGMGWLIGFPQGVKVCWIYGSWNAHSGLFLKVPQRGLGFIILANTNMLSRGSEWIGSDGDVMRSIVGAEFLNAFVFGTAELPDS